MPPQGLARRHKQESSSLPRPRQNYPAPTSFLPAPQRSPWLQRQATSAFERLAVPNAPRVAPESPKRLGEQHKSTLRPLPPESKLRKRPNPNSRRGWRSSRFKKLSSRVFPLRRNPPRSSRLVRQKKNLARPGTSEVRCWH